MALSILNRVFILVLTLLFGAQSVHSAFLAVDLENMICTCNHGSTQENHSASPEDAFFKKEGDSKLSHSSSIHKASKLPSCHSSTDKTDVHTCPCKKHDKSSRARISSSTYIKEIVYLRLNPDYSESDPFIDANSSLAKGYLPKFLKPPKTN
ncbi:hypothetical protein EHQ53_13905 [Leptospira langatensis]|uniref:Uncharacterized protein n=1 Tax=Leptospira langatensis TaxID=2484983 RepID=A0A5F1ZRG2_9LEPT|nr:hypothetical protein [Leptospira langatensis]TGK02544.1 hypothetical protein EHO57_04210 [Leptospira langatensis]TGL40255.1 hypothetical protein EHQ53_13905 [Leptospira langatensis]